VRRRSSNYGSLLVAARSRTDGWDEPAGSLSLRPGSRTSGISQSHRFFKENMLLEHNPDSVKNTFSLDGNQFPLIMGCYQIGSN
jgi:hypothetical protein